jgi:hypothetical protein
MPKSKIDELVWTRVDPVFDTWAKAEQAINHVSGFSDMMQYLKDHPGQSFATTSYAGQRLTGTFSARFGPTGPIVTQFALPFGANAIKWLKLCCKAEYDQCQEDMLACLKAGSNGEDRPKVYGVDHWVGGPAVAAAGAKKKVVTAEQHRASLVFRVSRSNEKMVIPEAQTTEVIRSPYSSSSTEFSKDSGDRTAKPSFRRRSWRPRPARHLSLQ